MLRPLLAAAVLCGAALATPAFAADAPVAAVPAANAPAASAPKPALSSTTTDIGTLLDNPATKAVLDKYLPGLSTDSRIDMARAMTLKQVQGYAPDQIKDESLAKVDAELAKIPAK